ncbi:hypothetical protein RRG08_043540 [Elysia crispata]|uniref:Uncharacterized protein n=1 Tax=Elysia crispata TaxID=231223 RepID=A0AAE0YFE6_9GAST|nr:hypothetical protein RRG08_043540 [Elysia crispata]
MDALFFSNHLLAYASPQHQRARSSKQRRTIATVYYCSWEQIGRSRISFTVVHQIFSGLLERYYHGNDPLIHALHRGKARTRLPPKPFTMRDFHWRHPYPVWMFDVVFKNRMHRGCTPGPRSLNLTFNVNNARVFPKIKATLRNFRKVSLGTARGGKLQESIFDTALAARAT